ncbi:MAG: amphi-Trp domain-containing protein [Candidatus Moranbacteria bacterium]|jgi:amphi-Trp domain-containing protein|nr:amphi-Trp domain-containing protein [Candidatus Moranbacteria bacterium]
MKKSKTRDIEKVYPKKEFIKKLRRLADALEKDKKFNIQVAGERLNIPKDAIVNIEHEKGKAEEELEFQIKWKK